MRVCIPALLLAGAAAAAPPKPHVVFFLADDYGWNDIGYHQNQKNSANPDGGATTNAVVATPTLDGLAHGGVRLENYYVEYVCSPTRGAIMTGRYPSHTGIGPEIIRNDRAYGMPTKEVFWPELMKDAGYATHMVGKWHLGFCDNKYLPNHRGFDTFAGYLTGAEDYYTHSIAGFLDFRNASRRTAGPGAPATGAVGTYSSVVFAAEASRVIGAHNASVPFFLYIAFQSVHEPMQAPQAYLNRYAQVIPHATAEGRQRWVKAAMVAAMDDAVADVVGALKARAMFEDTVIIFSTDNGAPMLQGQGGSNFPLRGWKATPWEGGVRGAAFIRGTDSALAPLPKNAVNMDLMHASDWLPTVVRGVAGGSTAACQALDGHDQWAALQGKVNTTRDFIVHTMPGAGAPIDKGFKAVIRSGQYKLLIPGGAHGGWAKVYQKAPPEWADPPGVLPTPVVAEVDGVALYVFDILADPTEAVNLAQDDPALARRLLGELRRYQATAVPDLALAHSSDPASSPQHRRDKTWGPYGCAVL